MRLAVHPVLWWTSGLILDSRELALATKTVLCMNILNTSCSLVFCPSFRLFFFLFLSFFFLSFAVVPYYGHTTTVSTVHDSMTALRAFYDYCVCCQFRDCCLFLSFSLFLFLSFFLFLFLLFVRFTVCLFCCCHCCCSSEIRVSEWYKVDRETKVRRHSSEIYDNNLLYDLSQCSSRSLLLILEAACRDPRRNIRRSFFGYTRTQLSTFQLKDSKYKSSERISESDKLSRGVSLFLINTRNASCNFPTRVREIVLALA